MKKRIGMLGLLMILTLVSAAQADDASTTASAGGNFVSGNKNNDGHYTPRTNKTIQRKTERTPGFWDKEWQRSGLDKTVGKAKWNPFSGTGKFLKEKEDAYKAKRAAAAPTAPTSKSATVGTTATIK